MSLLPPYPKGRLSATANEVPFVSSLPAGEFHAPFHFQDAKDILATKLFCFGTAISTQKNLYLPLCSLFERSCENQEGGGAYLHTVHMTGQEEFCGVANRTCGKEMPALFFSPAASLQTWQTKYGKRGASWLSHQ